MNEILHHTNNCWTWWPHQKIVYFEFNPMHDSISTAYIEIDFFGYLNQGLEIYLRFSSFIDNNSIQQLLLLVDRLIT